MLEKWTAKKTNWWLQVLRQTSKGVFVPLTVGGGIREFTDARGHRYSALQVAAEYFRSGADKVSIGSDAVDAAEELRRSGKKSGRSAIEQISWVCPDCPSSPLHLGRPCLPVAMSSMMHMRQASFVFIVDRQRCKVIGATRRGCS